MNFNALALMFAQGLFASGHILPEGVIKALGFPTILSALGIPINWSLVVLTTAPLSLLGGIPVHFNYAGRSGIRALPYALQQRHNNNQGFEDQRVISLNASDEEAGVSDTYQLNFFRRLQACSYVTFATIIEICDGAVAGVAVLPFSWPTVSKLAMGAVLGTAQALQSNLIYTRRGWELMAADQAVRQSESIAPLENYLGVSPKGLTSIARFLSAFTPLCFGVLHVVATAEIHTKLHDWLIAYLGFPIATVLKHGSRPLMFLFTASATTVYDIGNLGRDLLKNDSLVTGYPAARWIERKILCLKKQEEQEQEEEYFDTGDLNDGESRLKLILGNYKQYIKQHPVEAIARHIYGDSITRLYNFLLPKPLAVFIEDIWFSGGLFMLFSKALHTVYEELIQKLMGVENAMAWSKQLVGPNTTFTIISLLGTLAQFKQKWPALGQRWESDNESNFRYSQNSLSFSVLLRILGAFTTMAASLFAMGQLREYLGSTTTEGSTLFETGMGLLTTVTSQFAFLMGANWDHVTCAGFDKAKEGLKSVGEKLSDCTAGLWRRYQHWHASSSDQDNPDRPLLQA